MNAFHQCGRTTTRRAMTGVVVLGAAVIGLLLSTSVCPLLAASYPAATDVIQVARTNAADMVILWQPVVTDIQGRPTAVTGYNVYASSDPLFVPDPTGHTNRVAITNSPRFVDVGALGVATSRYYYVTAVASGGVESFIFTDLVARLSQRVICPAGTSVFVWVALPWGLSSMAWSDGSGLASNLGPIDRLYRFDDLTQGYEVWDPVAATGQNFALRGGEAYGFDASTSLVVSLAGLHSPSNLLVWTFSTNRFNHHWISVPAGSLHTNAESLAVSITGCTRVSQYDWASGQFLNWFHLAGAWRGTNFAVKPADGLLVSIASNATWRPTLPYPQVSLALAAPAGFIDLSQLSATASVVAADAVVEYQWDYDGDGAFDTTSGIPVLAYSKSFSAPSTWFPTLRARTSRGFYGVGAQRYDALSMSLDFVNQAFSPGLGQTSILTYASSTGGYFSTYIYDANSNIVRVLESDVFHTNGAATIGWDGRTSNGVLVTTGVYYVVVRQSLSSNAMATYNPSVLQRGSNLSYQVTGLSTPPSFDPYSGAAFPIQYTLPGPARVTVQILDSQTQPIAMVCTNALRPAGVSVEQWDGRLSDGAVIAQGKSFSVSVQAWGLGANALIVNPALAAVASLTASATKFMPALNPYGNNTNSLRLSYALSAASDVRVAVRRSDGVLVQSAIDPGKAAGANESYWPGTTSNGVMVAPGLYSVTVASEVGGVQGQPETVWAEVYY